MIRRALFALLSFVLLAAITPAQDTLVSMVGDKDGFGLGLVCGDPTEDMNLFTPGPEDPLGTDQAMVLAWEACPHPNVPLGICPAVALVHQYESIPVDKIVSATLELCTADIDNVMYPYDERLFLDGIEVAGAFDDVDQYVSGLAGKSGLVTFELAPSLFHVLADGRVEVLIDEDRTAAHWSHANGIGIDYSELTIVYEAPVVVGIDVKPGSDPNCFNINGHGVIPAAILGSADFDVEQVDPYSLTFDGLAVRVRGNRGPLCSLEDSNEDGFVDLVCHFEDDSDYWVGGDDIGTVSGALFDGTKFEGADSICIVP